MVSKKCTTHFLSLEGLSNNLLIIISDQICTVLHELAMAPTITIRTTSSSSKKKGRERPEFRFVPLYYPGITGSMGRLPEKSLRCKTLQSLHSSGEENESFLSFTSKRAQVRSPHPKPRRSSFTPFSVAAVPTLEITTMLFCCWIKVPLGCNL